MAATPPPHGRKPERRKKRKPKKKRPASAPDARAPPAPAPEAHLPQSHPPLHPPELRPPPAAAQAPQLAVEPPQMPVARPAVVSPRKQTLMRHKTSGDLHPEPAFVSEAKQYKKNRRAAPAAAAPETASPEVLASRNIDEKTSLVACAGAHIVVYHEQLSAQSSPENGPGAQHSTAPSAAHPAGTLLAHGAFEIFQLHGGDVTYLACGPNFVYPLLPRLKVLRTSRNVFLLPLVNPQRYWKIHVEAADRELAKLEAVFSSVVTYTSLARDSAHAGHVSVSRGPGAAPAAENSFAPYFSEIPESPPSVPTSPVHLDLYDDAFRLSPTKRKRADKTPSAQSITSALASFNFESYDAHAPLSIPPKSARFREPAPSKPVPKLQPRAVHPNPHPSLTNLGSAPAHSHLHTIHAHSHTHVPNLHPNLHLSPNLHSNPYVEPKAKALPLPLNGGIPRKAPSESSSMDSLLDEYEENITSQINSRPQSRAVSQGESRGDSRASASQSVPVYPRISLERQSNLSEDWRRDDFPKTSLTQYARVRQNSIGGRSRKSSVSDLYTSTSNWMDPGVSTRPVAKSVKSLSSRKSHRAPNLNETYRELYRSITQKNLSSIVEQDKSYETFSGTRKISGSSHIATNPRESVAPTERKGAEGLSPDEVYKLLSKREAPKSTGLRGLFGW